MDISLPLVLASGSPRRKELLSQLGYTFDVVKPDVDESQQDSESPQDYVVRLSRDKALRGQTLCKEPSIVLGSDTIVVVDDVVLEKPNDLADSRRMLTKLAARKHQVMTAVTVATQNTIKSKLVITDVWFKEISEQEIVRYWQSGEPCDKAGSYAIQGTGGRFVTRIEGSYHAVVGLPLYETEQLLHEFK